MSEQRVVIIGAGLAGSLLAIYLAKRGIQVDVYEARGDMRREEMSAGRSINLALSDRGIAALREVGMDEYMLAEAVPMYGRMIHTVSGGTKLLPYSGRQGEYINSVSRAGLNIALMNEAEKYPGVQFVFNERCVDFDCSSGEVMFESGRSRRADTVVATDGAGSAVRESMERHLPGFEMSSVFLEHGYKELHIPPAGDWSASVSLASDSPFLLEKNALHIWPRHQFMMIALPNSDGSFTCTLFLAHKSSPPYDGGVDAASADGVVLFSFDQLTTSDAVQDFFSREFPDAVPLMPTLVGDFFENPTGQLGTVKCWPWNVDGKALLLGDSAHAVVPFYGQGMNCAFEDVRMLDSLIEKHGTDWEPIYEEYGELRKINTDAIADMAEENFYEMRDRVADPVFQRKRELETKLEQTFPNYFSKYSMVTFREDLPYSVAKEKGNAQDRLLMEICAAIEDVGEIDPNQVMAAINELNSSPSTANGAEK
ncbi:MAG TPA: NAD(P)/FAD-dependent oxidoreductase [Pyrinomonadaceae bacterium]|nr:NAD(P)/FAD-dependent oxidoreductase [Pyrinomonadaceae bacterium]